MSCKLFKRFQFVFDFAIVAFHGYSTLARKKGVVVGSCCRIYTKFWGSEPFLIRIGDNVTIASGVRFLTHDGATSLVFDNEGSRYQRYGAINVGNNVFIGINAILMPGVDVGSNVIIGAGSIVTKSVPSGSVVAGSPAVLISNIEAYSSKIKSTCLSDSHIKPSGTSYRVRVFQHIRDASNK